MFRRSGSVLSRRPFRPNSTHSFSSTSSQFTTIIEPPVEEASMARKQQNGGPAPTFFGGDGGAGGATTTGPATTPSIQLDHPLRVAAGEQLKRDAQSCASLLRDIYQLDFQIWSSQNFASDRRVALNNQKMIQANRKLDEVRAIVRDWDVHRPRMGPDEARVMDEIKAAIRTAGPQRYSTQG